MTLYNSHNMCISNKHSNMMLTSVVGLAVLVSFSVAGVIPAVPTYNDFMNRIMINRNDWTRDSINKAALPPTSKTSGSLPGLLPGILPGVLPGNYPELSPDSLPPVPKAEGSLTDKPKPPVSPVSKSKCSKEPLYGMCEMKANPNVPSNINGTIYLRQDVNENCEYNFLNVQVNIDSVPMNDETTKHGFHIHTFGDLSRGCESMGPHYNPFGTKHGAPWNKVGSRHVGDFGNVIQRGQKGAIQTRIVDYLAKLHGEHSIYGRGMVLHEKKDDLGLGGNPGSEATGNAGRRLACCVIGKAPRHSRSRYNLY